MLSSAEASVTTLAVHVLCDRSLALSWRHHASGITAKEVTDCDDPHMRRAWLGKSCSALASVMAELSMLCAPSLSPPAASCGATAVRTCAQFRGRCLRRTSCVSVRGDTARQHHRIGKAIQLASQRYYELE